MHNIKRAVSLGLFSLLFWVLFINFSSNPPIDRTNRTGSNCTGCHSGTALNAGTGSITLSGFSSYYPGGSYTLNLDVTGGSIYGFEVTAARASSSSTSAGTFSGTGYNTTSQGGFSYARHNPANTSGSWNITWNAPSSAVGSVTFYAAGVAGNNNFTSAGDEVYATTYTITQIPIINYTVNRTNPSCFGSSNAKAYITGITGGTGGAYTITWPASFSTSGDTAVSLSAGTYNVTVTDGSGNEEVKSFTISQGSSPSTRASIRNSVCGGATGRITTTVTGGTAPYSYAWQGLPDTTAILDSISSGSYVLTVTDANGCTDVETVNVGQAGSSIQIFVSQGNDYCGNANGSLTLDSVVGNSGPVSILWSTGDTSSIIQGLSASTNYTISVTDTLMCTQTGQFSPLAVSNTISANLTTQPDFCASGIGSGSVSNVQGGIPPYNYVWSTGDTTTQVDSLFAVALTVNITDAVGCSAAFHDVVQSTGTPVLSMNDDELDCYGDSTGSLSVLASGGIQPYTYSWSGLSANASNLTNLKAGSYLVSVTDSAGCFDTIRASVLQPDSLILDSVFILATRPDLCQGKIIPQFSGGTAPYSLQWSDSLNTISDSLVGVCPGTYELVLTDANSCVKTFRFKVDSLEIPSALNEIDIDRVAISRNQNQLKFKNLPKANFSIDVFNLTGQLIYSNTHVSSELLITLPQASPVIVLMKSGSNYKVNKLL